MTSIEVGLSCGQNDLQLGGVLREKGFHRCLQIAQADSLASTFPENALWCPGALLGMEQPGERNIEEDRDPAKIADRHASQVSLQPAEKGSTQACRRGKPAETYLLAESQLSNRSTNQHGALRSHIVPVALSQECVKYATS